MRNKRSTLLFIAGTSFLSTYAEESKEASWKSQWDDLSTREILEPIGDLKEFFIDYGGGGKEVTREQYVYGKMAIGNEKVRRKVRGELACKVVRGLVNGLGKSYIREDEYTSLDIDGNGVISEADDLNNDNKINNKDVAAQEEKVKREQAKNNPKDKRKEIR